MTDPLVPIDVDLRDFGFMPLDVLRLRDSDLAALSTGDEFKAAVMLWCVAWHQVPAASLPNDDRLLARFSGAGSAWKKVRTEALRGFVLCDDGRLYHATIAEKARESWEAKLKQRERTKAATAAREAKRREHEAQRHVERNVERNDERDDQRDVERDVVQGTGTGTGTVKGQGQGDSVLGAAKPRPTRKCPATFLVDSGLQQWARETVPNVDIRAETAKLRDHTFKTAMTDWPGAWRNWMRKAAESTGASGARPVSFRARDQQDAADKVAFLTGRAPAPPTTSPQGDFIEAEVHDVTPRQLG